MIWRSLTPTERTEASLVFGEALDYDRIRLAEDAGWTNALPRLRAWLAGKPAPTYDNAITLGHRIHFPRRLDTTPQARSEGRVWDFGWLMHELTHVWQSERIGPRYIWRALRAQMSDGAAVYDYGGEDGLREAVLSGSGLGGFSVEQQGEIVRDGYLRRRLGLDESAWTPMLAELTRS
jgi:hypothetical protein